MELIRFEDERATQASLGGKAAGLATLSRLGFPVPKGAVLNALPGPNDWERIFQWWEAHGHKPLAIRSSASAEDGATTSFAGQNKSFLGIADRNHLQQSVYECFESIHQSPHKAYRDFFQKAATDSTMNVVLQEMVTPRFSGVFFSRDPRQKTSHSVHSVHASESGWILEVVPGYGESLVSGRVTPGRVTQFAGETNLPPGFTRAQAEHIATIGLRVRESLHFEVDMEWAIDESNFIQILQARPITTLHEARHHDAVIAEEMKRLEQNHSPQTQWDGQTFAEWSGFPSYFTFSIWKRAFSPHQAFGDALKILGYQSYIDASYEPKDSLLERAFGRAYVNLGRLTHLYYGPIPYSIESKPRPHTRFDWRKINLRMIVHLPSALKSMVKVSWNLSTQRRHWLERCTHELDLFKRSLSSHSERGASPLSDQALQALSDQELQQRLSQAAQHFAKSTLLWPFVLVILTESTVQRLTLILSQILGDAEAPRKMREWMGKGLHTITMQMHRDYEEACHHPEQRGSFLARYGHRGPGELDLVNPRWRELGEKAFMSSGRAASAATAPNDTVAAEIKGLRSFKREIVLEEWTLLQQMLELREQWKMEMLKPYGEMRDMLQILGQRLQLNADIHWLRLTEVESASAKEIPALRLKIKNRRDRFEAFRRYSFPDIVSLHQIRNLILDRSPEEADAYDGEALSPGVVHGEVRIVRDPHEADIENWPADTILVAETTDPGWTPLFARSKAIIVERGGVLSHCAIVAREMQIPAVSGIFRAATLFKNGDRLWVDGHHGRIIRDEH